MILTIVACAPLSPMTPDYLAAVELEVALRRGQICAEMLGIVFRLEKPPIPLRIASTLARMARGHQLV